MREILLSNSPLVALVDDEDYPVLARIGWYLDSVGYAHNTKYGRMHELVIGTMLRGSRVTDHADRNKLNNQKHNLRVVSAQTNIVNRGLSRRNTTGFKGVSLRKKNLIRPWMAKLGVKKHGVMMHHNLGYFATAEEAARAYDAKARELYGEYAYQNFPETAAIPPG